MTEKTGLVVKAISSIEEFILIKPQWDALVDSMEHPRIFFAHDWLRIWIECFLPKAPLKIIAVYEGDRLIGALPLCRTTFKVLRIFRRPCLHSVIRNSSTPSGLIVRLPDAPRVCAAIQEHLKREEQNFLIILEQVPGDFGSLSSLKDGFDRGLTKAHVVPMEESYYLDIEGDFNSYYKSLGKSFRKNMRQKGTALEAKGGARCEVSYSFDPGAFQRFLDMEDTGWKHEHGVLIKASADRVAFFRCLAETLSPKGQFVMMTFYIANTPVVMLYAVTFAGTYYSLKMAVNYEEADLLRFSPGQWMNQKEIEYCFEKKLRRFDFYGPCYSYEAHWAKKTYMKYEVTIFRRDDLLMSFRLALQKGFQALKKGKIVKRVFRR